MDNKLILMDLIQKYRDVLHNNYEYILCNQLLNKIGSSILTYNSDDVKLNLDEISSMTHEEIQMFSSPECERIISSLKVIAGKKGWRVETALKLIKKLQQDIVDNKMQEFKKQDDSLDELSKIIEEGLFKDNYNLVLDFIKMSVDNKMLAAIDAVNLNFYVLKEFNSLSIDQDYDGQLDIVELHENIESPDDIRRKLQDIFNKYGYVYDKNKMGDLDNKFVKHADVNYVDYILSKFKEYCVLLDDIYIRKRALYNIVIDNDRETLDSILEFIDENECSLSALLTIPSIFAKKKKNYVEKEKNVFETIDSVYEIVGANTDFFDNIALYKSLAGVSVIRNTDLDKLGRFLCTPSSIVKKNLLLLQKYRIISKKELPKAIFALCGNNTEYIIDRMVELDLYESYLSPRFARNGDVKQPRGTYFLDGDKNPFKFYKMKRAKDLGKPILASNAGIRNVFKNNAENYMGISYSVSDDGNYEIVQEPLSMDTINSINPEVRKELPYILHHQIKDGNISENVEVVYFNNLYKYKTFTPVEIFAASDKLSMTGLKGDRIASAFANDYKRVMTEEETKSVIFDNFIKMLDNAVYCDSDGNSRPLKVTDIMYEFSHPNFPNINVLISRYKVLRLCKLLKEDGCWINQNSSKIDKENTLLSVVLKDTIISDTEMIVVRMAIREILANRLIKVPEIRVDTKNKRGAR